MTMKSLLATCVLCLGLSTLALAEITDHGDYTHDSATGLYWLDVTLTQGLTYTEVVQRIQSGGPLEGWRYAVHTEFETLIQNFGIPHQGQNCYPTWFAAGTGPLYCDDIAPEYAETLEDLIRLLGDTEAPIWNPNPYTKDVSPTGAGMTRGILLYAGGRCGSYQRGAGWLEDNEFVYGRSTDPYHDAVDEIRSIYCLNPSIESYYGSFLVRDTEPTLPISTDLNPLPLPVVPSNGHLLFNNLSPEALGFIIDCESPFGTGPCTYGADSFTGITDTNGAWEITGWFGLNLDTDSDAQAQPWMRITGFDFTQLGGGCTTDNPIEHAGTKESATDLSLYEGGYGLCRIGLTDVDYIFLPSVADTGYGYYIPGTEINYASMSGGLWWRYTVDNVIIEFLPPNMTIEFDPWRDNEISPSTAYFAPIDLLTTSIADGDAFDFDANQVDLSTLTLGPDQAPNVAQPLVWDRDGDGDLDVTIGFRIEDSGLDCLDTEITVTGRTLTGVPLFGRVPVTPINCAKNISLDVDPFNATNQVRPDDSYVVLVGVKTTSIADGEADDVDALQIDPASLRFGPAGAHNVTTPITSDLDGDADTDVIFGFAIEETGILCGDTDVMLEGEQYDGYPLMGADTIITTDCEVSACHP
jgi:hypothetical protein